MTKTLYVGNLPWATTEDELTNFFSGYATVVGSRIITDRESGRSRGFGFVEVQEDEVEPIINATNGVGMGGRELIVNEAKPRPGR